MYKASLLPYTYGNVFIRSDLVFVEIFETIDTHGFVRFAVVLSLLSIGRLIGPVIRVFQICGSDNLILLQERKPVRPHVPLVLVQDNRSPRNIRSFWGKRTDFSGDKRFLGRTSNHSIDGGT